MAWPIYTMAIIYGRCDSISTNVYYESISSSSNSNGQGVTIWRVVSFPLLLHQISRPMSIKPMSIKLIYLTKQCVTKEFVEWCQCHSLCCTRFQGLSPLFNPLISLSPKIDIISKLLLVILICEERYKQVESNEGLVG